MVVLRRGGHDDIEKEHEEKRRTKPEQISRNVHLPEVLVRPLLPLRPDPLRQLIVRVRSVGETDEERRDVEEVGVVGFDGDVAARRKEGV